jgi:hypothetical protein
MSLTFIALGFAWAVLAACAVIAVYIFATIAGIKPKGKDK